MIAAAVAPARVYVPPARVYTAYAAEREAKLLAARNPGTDVPGLHNSDVCALGAVAQICSNGAGVWSLNIFFGTQLPMPSSRDSRMLETELNALKRAYDVPRECEYTFEQAYLGFVVKWSWTDAPQMTLEAV